MLFFVLGYGGYLSSLDKTPQVYLDRPNLKIFNPDYLIIAGKIVLAISLLFLSPIRWVLLRETVQSFFVNEIPFGYNFLLTFIGFAIINILVYFTKINQIINFLGGTSTLMISFFVPVFDYALVFKEDQYRLKRIISYIIFGLYIVIGILSTYKSIRDFFVKD